MCGLAYEFFEFRSFLFIFAVAVVARRAKQLRISKTGLHVFATPEFRVWIASTRKAQMICIFVTTAARASPQGP
jgi:hypothetical protein